MQKNTLPYILEGTNRNNESIWFLKIHIKIRWVENVAKRCQQSSLNCGIMTDFFLKVFIEFFCNEHIVNTF